VQRTAFAPMMGVPLVGVPAMRETEKTQLQGDPSVTTATLSAGLHTQMHEHVSAACMTKDTQRNHTENPCLSEAARKMRTWEKTKPKGVHRVAFCPGLAAESTNDVIHPCSACAGGHLVISSKPEGGHVHTGDVQPARTRAATPTRTEKNAQRRRRPQPGRRVVPAR